VTSGGAYHGLVSLPQIVNPHRLWSSAVSDEFRIAHVKFFSEFCVPKSHSNQLILAELFEKQKVTFHWKTV